MYTHDKLPENEIFKDYFIGIFVGWEYLSWNFVLLRHQWQVTDSVTCCQVTDSVTCCHCAAAVLCREAELSASGRWQTVWLAVIVQQLYCAEKLNDICSSIIMIIHISAICVEKVSVLIVIWRNTYLYILGSGHMPVMCVGNPLARQVFWKLISTHILESDLIPVMCVLHRTLM